MGKSVYLILSTDNGFYKIGVSNKPNYRIEQLKTGNSSPLKLIETYKSEFAYKIESVLKRRYSFSKKEGEWFNLSVDVEVNFKKICEKIEENIIFLKKNGNVFI